MRRIPIIFLLAVMTVWVRFPDWWWATHTPASTWFTGQASWVDQIDLPQYFRVIRMGTEQGRFQIYNIADSVGTETAFLYPVYTLIGILARPFTHDPVLAFHGAGAVMGMLLMLTAYWFLGLFITDNRWQVIGWYWLFLAGGIGWWLFPGKVMPDVGVPIFNLWSALRSPHEAITILSLLVFLGGTYLFFTKHRRSWLLAVGLATFGVLINHPQTIVPLGMIGGLYACISLPMSQWRTGIRWGLVVAGVSLGYYFLIGHALLTSSMSVGLRNQSTYVFPVWYWLAGWGVVGVGMIYGLVHGYKKQGLIPVWLLVQLGLFYLPGVPYRGMMIRGIWVAVVIAGVWGAKHLAERFKISAWMVGGLVLLLSLGDVGFIFTKRLDAAYVGKTAWLPQADGQLVKYLLEQGEDGEGVVGAYQTANVVMGATRLRPYVGHYPLTPHFMNRYGEVIRFYQGGMTATEAENWLKQSNISWVMMSSIEQQLAGKPQLFYPGLVKTWENHGVSVYRPSWALQSP